MSRKPNRAVKPETRPKTTPPTPGVRAVPPERWLVIQASAVLETVAAANYVCYGGAKVPRYGVANPPPPPQDPAVLCAEIIVRGPAGASPEAPDGALRLAELDTRFRLVEQSERQVIWVWADPARWFQAYWVWDFFRLLSHIVLRVGYPAPEPGADEATKGAWATLIDAVRSIAPGDTLSVRVQSPCGNIQQAHSIAAAAAEWRPPAAAGSPAQAGKTQGEQA